ncbi:TetR/AcrR family transcriptional regulator [Sutcliffiella sp. NC1]|uniref:TetR/AcrR family transcriptional regulator n=1 Tax=Sutcliffiella sp. NC1 TaxID=3004096 RepID=UPI0022DD3318|nr:TetR/AcrR family transcriptional regulator [Sutcliffiella sp. NC1]WBL15582.1 TetR/AcrR family transcriptional regulator [Sutcliffiella sp. NC1]
MRRKLIEAALHQYSLHGYHGATMRKIADEVGIKPASIYFFFENKEELFIAAFEQLLEAHFQAMQTVLAENEDHPVEEIFSKMLHGIASHHTGDMQGTIAFISLVTSPIPEIDSYLKKYMLKFNNWLVDSLQTLIKQDYPTISDQEVDRIIKQYVLIGNGVFWGINLYEGESFKEQVELADSLIQSLFIGLDKKEKETIS